MFSAARTARRSESPLGVLSAAAAIFWSTYAGEPQHVLRIERAAYRVPLPVDFDREDATLRHLDFQCVELLEHLADA